MTPVQAVVTPSASTIAWTQNLGIVPLDSVPASGIAELRSEALRLCAQGARLVALLMPTDAPELVAVLACDDQSQLAVLRATLADRTYPSLTPELPAAQAFEREIFETRGVRPEGHPWLKPLRRHIDLERPPGRGDAHEFFQVEGAGLHEVAVGPVHAGIIEPGHFRFQCSGEQVLHLEIQLGYQHRGAEAQLLCGSPARRLAVAESIAGDTVLGHAVAYVAAMEALGDTEPPLRAHAVRGLALEFERLANHVGDLGALCNDVGFLPGASWLSRLRGEFLNLLLELSGNRFGRGLVKLGGVRFDVTTQQRKDFLTRLTKVGGDVQRVLDLVFETPSVVSRFEDTGIITRDVANALGVIGPVARACGCDRDVRRDHPTGLYRFAHVPVAVADAGDVMARALVRAVEIERSLTFIKEQLQEMPEGPLVVEVAELRPGCLIVSLVEGWRGEIAHVAITNRDGELCTYKIVDPSFHNWFALALALRGQPISDFPLCNKSFNLSYAGHDL